MKKILMIALFCITLFAGQSVFAQTDAPSESNPTFEETMKLLQKSFADYGTYTNCPDDKDYCYTRKHTIERFDQKNLVIKSNFHKTGSEGDNVKVYEILWSDLENNLSSNTDRAHLRTVNNKSSIKVTNISVGSEDSTFFLDLTFTTEDIAVRVQKALNHAITLQGAGKKKEIF